MTDLSVFRVYEPHELRAGRYPHSWDSIPCPKDTDGDGDCGRRGCPWCGGDGSTTTGIKDLVRREAGHRCVRCLHPYRVGESGEWEMSDRLADRPSDAILESLDTESMPALRPPVGTPGYRVLWSDCDERCRHGGPCRARVTSGRPWEGRPAATPADVAAAIAQGNQVQAAWRILTCHHLNERKEDCRWHNLVALCQRLSAVTSRYSGRSR